MQNERTPEDNHSRPQEQGNIPGNNSTAAPLVRNVQDAQAYMAYLYRRCNSLYRRCNFLNRRNQELEEENAALRQETHESQNNTAEPLNTTVGYWWKVVLGIIAGLIINAFLNIFFKEPEWI